LLQIIFLNLTLDSVDLCTERRKPFNLSTEDLLMEKNRGDWTPIELFGQVIASWDQHTQALLIAA